MIISFINHMLKQRWVLWTLFIINLLGTVYGFYWYKNQIASTPLELVPFVPDSPTASLFFTLFLLMILINKKSSFIAAFAAVTSIKYGIWAVVAIVWGASLGDPLYFDHYMLIFSHLGMAVEAILFYRFYRIKWIHLVIVAVWTLINDLLDYTLEIHPWTTEAVEKYHDQLGWFTLVLSIVCISFVAFLVQKQRRESLSLQ